MSSAGFDSAYIVAEQQLNQLEQAIQQPGDTPPNPNLFHEIRPKIERLARICPAEQEGQVQSLEQQFNQIQIRGKERYIQTIDQALENSSRLFEQQVEVNLWIDCLQRVFHDEELSAQKRNQFNLIIEREQSHRLLSETRKRVEELWERGKTAKVVHDILSSFDEAVKICRNATRQAGDQKFSSEASTQLHALLQEAEKRHDVARSHHEGRTTLDDEKKFSKLIADFEAEDPATEVTYYRGATGEDTRPVKMSVAEALPIARKRWENFATQKALEYRKKAVDYLAHNDPEQAREALDEIWRVGIPGPEILLDANQSPVDIGSDLRAELKETIEKTRQAETALRDFRSQLEAANQNPDAEKAWHTLISAERNFPQFEGKDRVWQAIRSGIVNRYREYLRYQLTKARDMMLSDPTSLFDLTTNIQQAASGHPELETIREDAAQLQKLAQDIPKILQDIERGLETRQPRQAVEGKTRIAELEQRLSKAGIVEPSARIRQIQARVDAIVEIDTLLSRLEVDAMSNDVSILQTALEKITSISETIPADRTQEFASIRLLLEARQSLILGQCAFEQGDLQKALNYLHQAKKHHDVQPEAQQELEKVAQTVQADEEVRSALEANPHQPPCQAMEDLRHLRNAPTLLRQELNAALKKAEDRCLDALEKTLAEYRQNPNFEVLAVQQVIERINSVNTRRANEFNLEFAPLIADRLGYLAWKRRAWTQSREQWERASQHNPDHPTFANRYLAALKQETLEMAGFFAQSGPHQAARAIDILDHRLQRELPGDAHLLIELSRTRLELASDQQGADSMELFSRTEQVTDQALRRTGEWKLHLPSYEQTRQELLTEIPEPFVGLDVLLQQAMEITGLIRQEKRVARRKSVIGNRIARKTLPSVLGALREYDQVRQGIQDEQAGQRFERWWQNLVDETIITCQHTLSDLDETPDMIRDQGGLPLLPRNNEAADVVWNDLEHRLIILVLEPTNPDGQEALNGLPNHASQLAQQFTSEVQNTSGAGLPGPEDKVLDHHITHIAPLSHQMTILEKALEHLATHAHSNTLIPPPNSTWIEQRDNFNRLKRPFYEFQGDLIRFNEAKKKVEQQIETALCTGEWQPVEDLLSPSKHADTTGIPSRFQGHRTLRWLRDELKRSQELRNRQIRRRDEILWCLHWQHSIDAHSWSNDLPPADEGQTQRLPREEEQGLLREEEWVRTMRLKHHRQAQTPVEMKSLLELALELLEDMHKEDEKDRCCLDNTLKWIDPSSQRRLCGFRGIKEAIVPILEQMDRLRQYLQPVTGGRRRSFQILDPNGDDAPTGSPSSDTLEARKIDWKKICGEIDRLRQERKFPEASDLCRRAMGEETEGPAWSLNRTRTYLSRHPVGNQSLLSGLSCMLNDCLEQQRRDIAADYAEAEMILKRLQDFQEEYELLWGNFSNALDSYLRLQRRSQIPLIGNWLRRGRGLEEALEGARKIYRECYALCPRDANLLSQRGLLGVEARSETIRPLSEGTEAKKGTSSW